MGTHWLMKFIVDRSDVERFKRRARAAAPNEYVELIFGTVSDSTVKATRFERIKHRATKRQISYEIEDFDRVVSEQVDDEGLIYIGTVHSHPNGCPEPSYTDNDNARIENELVFGIYGLPNEGKRGVMKWWLTQNEVKPVTK